MSGLSESEAKEFHQYFTQGFVIFIGVAILAHILAWAWRPWIPGDGGYTSFLETIEGTTVALAHLVNYVA